jgi:radical SAM superfamily enzyme YgiQ (UPF0313 family)
MISDKIVIIYAQDYLPDNAAPSYPPEDLNIPLGILYLGSHLKAAGQNARLMDTRLYKKNEFFRVLQDELRECALAGLSVTTPCVKIGLEITRFVKTQNPGIKTVWGGVHASLYPDATVNSGYIDFVIAKEGEEGLLGLAQYLLEGKKEILDIPNLIFKEGGKIKKNIIKTKFETGSIGIADYALLDMEKYIERTVAPGRTRRQIEMLTARGCPYRCTFCVNTILYECKWRDEPVSDTLKKLDDLIRNYKIGHIFFMDEDFFCNRSRIRGLVKEIAGRNITWEANCRADYINDSYIDDKFLELIKKSGCVKLRFGLESGSQRILDLLKKEITVNDSLNMAKRLAYYGIVPAASFMMGLPDETEDDILKTMDLISRLLKSNPAMKILGPAIFRPYPGSELFEKCRAKGLNAPAALDEWSDFYMSNNMGERDDPLPWFPDTYMFKRVWLCLAHLRFNVKNKIFRNAVQAAFRFHLATRLKFIGAEYFLYRFLRKSKVLT